MDSSIELVNAVGGGDVHSELDLDVLLDLIDAPVKRYDPEYHPSLYLKLQEGGTTILVFRTGKYNIAGAESIQDLVITNKRFLCQLSELGIDISDSEDSFEVRNLVFNSEFDAEFDLSTLVVGLGLEYAEYEPEQFPGVQYKPPTGKGVFLIFRTGKVILTGATKKDVAEDMFRKLRDDLRDMGAI